MTSTQSPSRTDARRVSMCMAVLPASVKAADVVKSTPAGSRHQGRGGHGDAPGKSAVPLHAHKLAVEA